MPRIATEGTISPARSPITGSTVMSDFRQPVSVERVRVEA